MKSSSTRLGRQIAFVKNTIFILAPFLLLHLYIKSFYNAGLPNIFLWWAENWREFDNFWGITVFSLLGLFFTAMLISAGFERAYLYTFGENQDRVYTGNVKESTAIYYPANDLRASPIEAQSPVAYNTRFDRLYTIERFKKDRGANTAGMNVKEFHPMRLAAYLLLTLSFLSVTLPLAHVYAYPVEASAAVEGVQLATQESLDQFLAQWNLSLPILIGALFAGLLLGIILWSRAPNQPARKAFISLPASVHSGSRLRALPVHQKIQKERDPRYTRDRGPTRMRDSGYRYAVFKFTDGFRPPAYVTAYYHRREYPGLQEKIDKAIGTRQSMELEITEELGVAPVQ